MNTLRDATKRALGALLEVVEIGLIAFLTVFVIRTYLVQPFLVNGASMEPNFSNNDYLLIDELTYRFREPVRGEVVVFRYPGDRSTFYIKRIIGLPGERVTLIDGAVTVYGASEGDSAVLNESYLTPGLLTRGEADVTLGEEEYFVMGDNRPYSFDSRSWGTLPEDHLIGIARLRLWPLAKVDAFETPAYE